jgi:pimeloyl-ACP methyl ester carboxylesterase
MATALHGSGERWNGDVGGGTRGAWMAIDWREHLRWLVAEDTPVNVVTLGEGPPILFVHGLGGCWQNWLEQIPVFAEDHRVIALDLPGFGASPMPKQDISISGYARIVDEVCSQLGVDAAALVGNSMGGLISAELAINFPQRVERLVLVSSTGLTAVRPAYRPAHRVGRRLENLLGMTVSWVVSRSEAVARRPGLRRLAMTFPIRHPERMPTALAYEQIRGSGKPGSSRRCRPWSTIRSGSACPRSRAPP